MITLIMILGDHGDHGLAPEPGKRSAFHKLTPARQAGYNAGMSDLTSTIASLQRRVEEIAVHL